MTEQTNLVPKRRFKEFQNTNTSAWEQREFSELVTRVSISSEEDELPRIEYEDVVSGQGVLNKDIIAKESEKKGIEFVAGDTLFGKLRPYLQNWLLPDFKGIAVGDWWVLRPNGMDSKFIYNLIQCSKYQTVANLSTGTKMPRSDWKIVSTTEFAVPTDKAEQAKIGELFSTLDHLITLHQRKLEKMKALKSAYLSEMFPVEGEREPKRRFAGFTGAWEQRKLGEIGKTQSGIGFPDIEQGGKDGVPFFKVSDMNNNGNEYEMLNANNYVSVEQIRRKSWKPIETVPAAIFAKVGAAIMLNRKRLVRNPFLIDNNTMAYIFDESWDVDFGRILFETIYLPRFAQVGALPSYNGSDVEGIKIFVPTLDEQKKIGIFFKELDNTIALHQRKLEKLQNLKKAYLNEMFV
ncbi:restriction endonuclease subunit S [Sporolactobacillus terrae]|uniref:Restriction endonuclease subunit S n=1 Tax=Sporolactobacillus terrae TaxID=269673 RepID=A0ABX5Q964_9BACL|nr:restriction endonuclease subunit S [Sporolactobacillus terrae]QAA23208.1 restriction endonuclease subunit S [Sporolactobacillus terrae]QAA26178.1 restriction endonuclease subunit S [Sporolactobacillus terrae]UAK15275.1 restriction endonuclease subunit S [Sporolactobacillus terrae]